MKNKECKYQGRIVDDNQLYGTNKELDRLVDSKDVHVRMSIARQGYGVDKLKDDKDSRVRAVIAKNGYYPQQFIKDSNLLVRHLAQRICL